LNIGLSAGFLSHEEVFFFKWYKSRERVAEEPQRSTGAILKRSLL
jgi:hypothetical protein